MNARRALKWGGVTIGVFAVLLLGLVLVDWNALRGPIARFASEKSGRPVRIGELDVRLVSPTPSVTVSGLEIGNPRWAGPGNLAEVGRATVKVRLAPLLVGNLVFSEVRIERSRLNLLTNEDGDSNWSSPRERERSGGAPDLPVVHRFELEPTRVSYVDRRRDLEFEGVVAADERTYADDARPFRLAALGEMNDKPFRLNLQGGALVNVRRNRPYPYVAEVVAGPTRARAEGAITRPFNLGQLHADVSISGQDLAELFYLTGLALPNTPPYEVTGHFERDATRVHFRKMNGRVGDSDLSGDVSVELKGRRPFVEATLASRSLDLDDVATWFGAPPSVKEGETASPRQKQVDARLAESRRLLPDAKLNVKRVHAMDAKVAYRAPKVRSGRFPIRSIELDLRLNDGVLRFQPVSLRMPQGNVSGTLKIDATREVPGIDLDARLTDIQLGQFKPKKSPEPPLEGVLRGRVQLHGSGDSVRTFAANSDGVATFVLPKGEVRAAFAELTGINVARGLGLLMKEDEDKTLVRCGVAHFEVNDGILQAETLVFDTDNVLINGRGTVSLDDETFDLSIRGEPKKLRFLRVRSPISVEGPLRKPSVGLEAGKAAGQTGVAAALGALVAPLAAVFAFVDPGLAEDANCSALLAEAKKDGAPVKTAEVQNADDDKAEKR